jgi:hypothetical protein
MAQIVAGRDAGAMRRLYRRAWKELASLRAGCREIEPLSTPVLAFGRWKTAEVVTAGLNPSEIEFREPRNLRPLTGDKQRFIHWEDGSLSRARLDEALRRCEGYFELGNAYTKWFKNYDAFLEGLGLSFFAGTACHTDYVSPYATIRGISECPGVNLSGSGEKYWLAMLEACPKVRMIFGHGRGWRRTPEILGGLKFEPVATAFDRKGNPPAPGLPRLWFGRGRLPATGRSVLVYWWTPNRSGAPLCYLNRDEKFSLGRQVREHAAQHDVYREK